MSRALPVPDRDSTPWWEALRRHELTLQRCRDCERLRWPARAICNRCGGLAWDWTPASGRGRIATWLVNHHTFGGTYESPSTAVQVRLVEQDDIVIPGAWDGPPDGRGLEVDLPVTLRFEDLPGEGGETVTLLRWAPAD